ncbi:MAG: hypothetical protein OMOMHJEC_01884 [Xanthomonadales bacterium]|nr:hypothetical protein [Xanthomonadales bacterium]
MGNVGRIRQTFLNNAYDALMDLADLTGVPPRTISTASSADRNTRPANLASRSFDTHQHQ